jgi:hypothetical protein
VLKALSRSDPDSAALLIHLGRGFIVEATLRVGEDTCLRCQSRWDIAAAEVFAVPDEAGPDAFAAHVERCGRVEATWFPFTAAPWMKLWSQAPERPWSSRPPVRGPYNFPFTDGIAHGGEGSHSAVVISTLDGKQDRLAVSPSAG